MNKRRVMLVAGAGAPIYTADQSSLAGAEHSNLASTVAGDSKVNGRVRLWQLLYLSGNTGTITIGDKDGNAYVMTTTGGLTLSFSAPATAMEAYSIDLGGMEFEDGLSAESTAANFAIVYESLG